MRDTAALIGVLNRFRPEVVIHLAGLKSVAESARDPFLYYDNNVGGSLSLIKAMQETGVKNLVFSSSATVYGQPERLPLTEDCRLRPYNVYGRTKLMTEQILTDLFAADAGWNITLLRYFNPVGAHPSGLIGEEPGGVPNNLMPYIAKVALGQLPFLNVYGSDYATPDGTGVRDYIHIVDLARGHLAALDRLKGFNVYNLGTGYGYSVLQVLHAFESVCGKELPYKFCDRRDGDLPSYFASPLKAERELNWKAEKSLAEMCADMWRWTTLNPYGYN